MCEVQANYQALVGDHVTPEVAPVGVLAGDCAVQVGQFVHGLVRRVSGKRRELGGRVEDDVGPEVVTNHVEPGPGPRRAGSGSETEVAQYREYTPAVGGADG